MPSMRARPRDSASEGIGHEPARGQHLGAVLGGRGVEEGEGRAAEAQEHEEGEEEGPAQQQGRLHDLHPGGGDHPPEEDVDQHHRPHDDDGGLVGQAEQEPDEVARPHHLRDEVEGHHGQGAEGGGHPHRGLAQAVGHHVREGVLAQVPQGLRDQEHHDGPAHEEADGVDEAVEAREGHEAGDAQEAGRAHVVAGEGEAVLEAGDAAARRVEVLGGVGAPGRPPGDAQGERR